MHPRFAYIVSGMTHALLLWALASAEDLVPAWFAVRSGHAAPAISQAAHASLVMIPLDSRLEPAPEVTLPAPEFPEISPQPSSPPPPAAALDERYVERPPIEEVIRRKTERSTVAAVLPDAQPMPLDPEVDAPKSDGRRRDMLWTAVPMQETPAPERITPNHTSRPPTPTTVAEVVEPGDSKINSVSANTPQGAKVDRLPRQLPTNREPEYPDELRRRRIGGRVVLSVTIGADGQVETVEVATSSGQPALDRSALDAVRNWRFEPAQRGGKPVSFDVRLPINFTIRG